MIETFRIDPRDYEVAERRVAERYREGVIASHPVAHAVSLLSKTLIGRAVIAVAGVAVAGAVATVAAPGLAIAGGGFAATLLVAYSRNKARDFDAHVVDKIEATRKSGIFARDIEFEMDAMAEHQLRLMAEMGAPVDVKKLPSAGAAFNTGRHGHVPTGQPLTGGHPEVLAVMRQR